jgi:hypothetical protein
MEPKLTKQSEAILARLKKDVEKQLLTPEQFEFLRRAMLLQESFGILSRFIIGAAAFIGAGLALLNFIPGSGR